MRRYSVKKGNQTIGTVVFRKTMNFIRGMGSVKTAQHKDLQGHALTFGKWEKCMISKPSPFWIIDHCSDYLKSMFFSIDEKPLPYAICKQRADEAGIKFISSHSPKFRNMETIIKPTSNSAWDVHDIMDRNEMMHMYNPHVIDRNQRPARSNEDFEGKALFQHQYQYGDITEHAGKIAEMTNSEKDRYILFTDESRILQASYGESLALMNDPEHWMTEINCTLPQAQTMIELLKVIEPQRSDIKREIMGMVKYEESFVNHEQWLSYLANIANELLLEETPAEDALNYQEPFDDNLDITKKEKEQDVMERAFRDDTVGIVNEYTYHTVYKQGNWEPFLTDVEFKRLKIATDEAETPARLIELSKYLFENTDHILPDPETGFKRRAASRLTYEQSQDFWDAYRDRKESLMELAKNAMLEIIDEIKQYFEFATESRQIRYKSAWLYSQFKGEKFNGKPVDDKFRFLDSWCTSQIWDTFNELKNAKTYTAGI